MNCKYQAIVFDFDGVLVESVSVKGDAFYALYEAEGKEIQQKVLKYHLAHGGVTRYEKIRYYEKTLLGRTVTEDQVNAIADRFSDIVEQKVIESAWVPGAKAFLETHQGQLPLFVNSATPQEELERIVAARGMTSYFQDIFGTPIKKADHLVAIAKAQGFKCGDMLMVGDAMADYEAAQTAGTHFIGRNLADNSIFPEGTMTMQDLTELADFIHAE